MKGQLGPEEVEVVVEAEAWPVKVQAETIWVLLNINSDFVSLGSLQEIYSSVLVRQFIVVVPLTFRLKHETKVFVKVVVCMEHDEDEDDEELAEAEDSGCSGAACSVAPGLGDLWSYSF